MSTKEDDVLGGGPWSRGDFWGWEFSTRESGDVYEVRGEGEGVLGFLGVIMLSGVWGLIWRIEGVDEVGCA
jgi:hypothetical protein